MYTGGKRACRTEKDSDIMPLNGNDVIWVA